MTAVKTLIKAAATDFIGDGLLHVKDNNLGQTVSDYIAAGVSGTIGVSETANLSASLTLPPNLYLKKIADGVVAMTGTASIAFAGVGLENADRPEPLFTGTRADQISWTGAVAPPRVSTEIVIPDSVPNAFANSLTERLRILSNALSGKTVTLLAAPGRIINRKVATGDNHSIKFLNGLHGNAYDRNDTRNGGTICPLEVGSNARIYGESRDGAIVKESSIAQNSAIVTTRVNCENTTIERIRFQQNPGAVFDGLAGGVSVNEGSKNCHIKQCWADGIGSYQFIIQGGNDTGNVPEYCTIDGNYSTGYLTQLFSITGGKNCAIINNVANLQGARNDSQFTVIDIEPNRAAEYIEDLLVANNYLDVRNVRNLSEGYVYFNGVFAQSQNTRGIKGLILRDNTVIAEVVLNAYLQTGYSFVGVEDFIASGNKVRGVYTSHMTFSQCTGGKVFDNVAGNKKDTLNSGGVFVDACANVDFYDNFFENPNCFIAEKELAHKFTATASNILRITAASTSLDATLRVYNNYVGQQGVVKDSLRTVTAVDTDTDDEFQTFTVDGAAITAATKSFLSSAIDADDNSITIPNHGFVQNETFFWNTSAGAVPGGLTQYQIYYAIVVDQNTVKPAMTRSAAVANSPVNILTAANGGVHDLTSVFVTKFSSNTYKNNRATGGITIEPTGASQVFSVYDQQ